MSLRSITLVLTTHCNLRCAYCLLGPGRRRTASWPVLHASLDRVVALAGDDLTVQFTGGEPLTALSLMRSAVAHLEATRPEARRLHWEVVTNGLLLTDPVVEFLDHHEFAVTISFDGVKEAQAERGPGTFERLDALLDRLRTTRPSFFSRLTVAMTVTPAAVPHLARSLAYFTRKRVPRLTFKPSVPGETWVPSHIGGLALQFEAFERAVRLNAERTGTVTATLFGETRPRAASGPSEWACGVAEGDSVTIDVDGCAYSCIVAAGSYQGRTAPVLRAALDALALGPAASQELGDRLGSMPEKARASGVFTHPEERYSSYGRCADCEYLGRCRACPLAAAADATWLDARRVPDFVCAWNQVTLAHQQRFPPGVEP